MVKLRILLLVLLALVVVAAGSARASQASGSGGWRHAAPMQLVPGGAPGAPTPPKANYDEQIGLTFSQGFSSLAYNVTAVAQTDSDGYGPAYLLNGLTDGGYWYQIGVSYDWPFLNGGYVNGFAINFEVFDVTGTSVFPAKGGGGLDNFTGPVNSGDNVLLRMVLSGGNVAMSVRDWNTGSTGSETYAAHGARFVGLSTASNSNGFFTGLMSEWYHVNPYYGSEGAVTYSSNVPLSSATVWADEFNANTSVGVFGGNQFLVFTNPTQLQSFSNNGATAYADAYTFITGALNRELLTLSYAVRGGGAGYLPPTLTYTLDGAQQTATLTATPTTFFADTGSSWQVTSSLAGGSASERWRTNQPSGGTPTSSLQESLVYYHQFMFTFGFSVKGGGTGYSSPGVQFSQFGVPGTFNTDAPWWVDAGSSYAYTPTLTGATDERWVLLGAPGYVNAPGTASEAYQHQYRLTLTYVILGGGSPTAPFLNGTQAGTLVSIQVTNSSSHFLDAGTSWSLPSLLPSSSSQERWTASQPTGGTMSAGQNSIVTYQHQYALTTEASPSEGGIASVAHSWEDAGSTVQVSQTASGGWQFAGWNGTGTGSYSGTSATAAVTVGSPVTETATFYPGLFITAVGNGGITYSYGARTGNVPGGSSQTVYAPVGTRVALQANPSSFLYSFSGWSQGSSTNGAQATVMLDGPTSVKGTFALNTIAIEVIGVATAAVVAAAVLGLRLRGRSPT